jgi:hypothetical protein
MILSPCRGSGGRQAELSVMIPTCDFGFRDGMSPPSINSLAASQAVCYTPP